MYSSRHLTADQAAHQLLQSLGLSESQATVREVRFRTGKRRSAWVANCVAIGLSAGFIEPLESTGIFLVQRAIDDLAELLLESASGHTPINVQTTAPALLWDAARARFNGKAEQLYDEIRDFVLLHYVLSQRSDTRFWQDTRSVTLPDSLANAMARYRRSGDIVRDQDACFADANHHFIYAGGGVHPNSHQHSAARRLIAQLGDRQLQSLFTQVVAHQSALRRQLPKHHELLQLIHSTSPSLVTAA